MTGIATRDWYEENIEVGVRDVVKMLRDNGINTTCSCHHDMEIEADVVLDGALQDIHNLLCNHFFWTGEEVTFEIVVTHRIKNSCWEFGGPSVLIKLNRKKASK